MIGSIRSPALRPAVPVLLLLAGCTPSLAPDIYATRAVQQANRVEQGVVVQARRVRVEADGTTGAAAGAGIGAAAGGAATVGNSFARTLGAIGGGVVGGLAWASAIVGMAPSARLRTTATEKRLITTVPFSLVLG